MVLVVITGLGQQHVVIVIQIDWSVAILQWYVAYIYREWSPVGSRTGACNQAHFTVAYRLQRYFQAPKYNSSGAAHIPRDLVRERTCSFSV